MARSSAVIIKVIIGLAVVGLLGVLFVRSAISTRAEPYTTRAEWLRERALTNLIDGIRIPEASAPGA